MTTYPKTVLAALAACVAAMEADDPREVAASDVRPIMDAIGGYVAQYRAEADPLLERATALYLRVVRARP